MSRRYRLELDKGKQVEQELEQEEDKLKLQRERIYAPVIWQRLAIGFRIEDLKENRYDEVLEMFKVNCNVFTLFFIACETLLSDVLFPRGSSKSQLGNGRR